MNDFQTWSSPATAGDIIKSMQISMEELALMQYSVFIGSADTIESAKKALENNPKDLEFAIFEENKNCEKGKLIFVKDKALKKVILTKHGILKDNFKV